MRARGIAPARILEPTCGSGAFLSAAAHAFPAAGQLLGIEYQRERFAADLRALERAEPRLRVRYANVYAIDFSALEWCCDGPLLVVGNPPWITAAALGRGNGDAPQPPRSNPNGLRGLAARMGAANFDVAEFLILKLLRELRGTPLVLALLVKESVARSVATAAERQSLGVAAVEIVRIDARAWFGVAVDACCLIVRAQPGALWQGPVPVYGGFDQAVRTTFTPRRASVAVGPAIVFRQGIKHDAADVFELRRRAGAWHNGYGQAVDIEPEHIYPLRKARALQRGEDDTTALVIPQFRLGAPTAGLAADAPSLWRYLTAHRARLAARKSSIYRRAPEFALFGIGEYSFAPWKVAVAGLYAEPRFRLLGPQSGRCIVVGDTAYFAAFEREDAARAFAELCASPAVAAEIARYVVRGKRPITKALLDGVDWMSLAGAPNFATILAGHIR